MAKSPNSGFTDEEMAEMNTGADESEPIVRDDPPDDHDEPEPAPKAKAPAESKAGEKANGKAKDGEEGTKPPPGYVPQSALHEARQHAKEAKERAEKVEQMWQRLQNEAAQARKAREEQQRQASIPDKETDPVGYLEAMLQQTRRELDEQKNQSQLRTQEEREQAQTNDMLNRYASSVAKFIREEPTYDSAYQFLVKSADAELEAMGYDDPEERTNMIQYEEGRLAGLAIRRGQDPAKAFYARAKSRGWKPETPQGQQQQQNGETEESKLTRLAKGQRAAKSLAGAKGDDPGEAMTIENLTKLEGDAFDKMFEKMKRAGALG